MAADCRRQGALTFALCEAMQNTRLASACVPNQNELEQVIVIVGAIRSHGPLSHRKTRLGVGLKRGDSRKEPHALRALLNEWTVCVKQLVRVAASALLVHSVFQHSACICANCRKLHSEKVLIDRRKRLPSLVVEKKRAELSHIS